MIREHTLRSSLAFRALCGSHFESGERRRVMSDVGLTTSGPSSMIQVLLSVHSPSPFTWPPQINRSGH